MDTNIQSEVEKGLGVVDRGMEEEGVWREGDIIKESKGNRGKTEGSKKSRSNWKGEVLEEPAWIYHFPKRPMKFQIIFSKSMPTRMQVDREYSQQGINKGV